LRLGLYGGTFDPFHGAHLTVALAALRRFHLDRVLVIPASDPPHKPNQRITPYEHRYRMVEIATAGYPALEPSRLEDRPGRSYSIDTIELVRARHPQASLFLIIGADAFAEIGTWWRLADVVASVEFLVVTRPGHHYDTPPGARVHALTGLALPVSSSEIRQQLARGERPADLPEGLFEYLIRFGLYSTEPA
jgi:nicotinate-nucleotide adenylyltransferase